MVMTKPQSMRKTKFLLGLALASLSLTACFQGGGKGASTNTAKTSATTNSGSSGDSTNTGGNTVTEAPPTNPIAAQVVNVGIKNFDQVNATFSVLTGVPETNANVRAEYNAIRASLPLNNDIRTFGGSTQNALLKLAARYCDEAMRSDALRVNVLPGNLLLPTNAALTVANVDNTVPAQALTPANNAKIVDFMIDKFWNRPANAPANEDDMRLITLINELALNEAASGTTTRNVLTGVCTAALANANVFTM